MTMNLHQRDIFAPGQRRRVVSSRIAGWASVAFALIGACAATGAPPSTAGTSASTAERDSVVRCYSNAYRKRTGVGPALDDKTDTAAEQLLATYNGNPRRTCEVITAALANSACGAGATLSSVVTCDRRTGRAPSDLDPTSKAQLETRVREHESREMSPSGRGY
jgi:hypothetical protein